MNAEVLTPETLNQQGQSVYKAGDYEQAAEIFGKAAESYAARDDALNAAEMNNNRSVALLQAGDAAAALQAAEGTDATFAAGGDPHRQAMALGNQAAALESLGRLKESLERYQASSDLLKQLDDREMRSYVLKRISSLQMRLGHQLESLAAMDVALDSQPHLSLREKILKKLLGIPFHRS